MSTQAERVKRLVKVFGGISAMARALGHAHPSTVQGWKERGAIPRWRYYEIRNSEFGRSHLEVVHLMDRLEGGAVSPILKEEAHPHNPLGCRYIDGDPKGVWAYCNRPQRPGSPYCEEHHALCRVSAKDPAALAALEAAVSERSRAWDDGVLMVEEDGV
ncbi:MAG: hypothetical protein JXQ84_07910 [Rhodospirillaceae bacterium]|nr:hypothetical protein [Rhodospirillaceae bacterium]